MFTSLRNRLWVSLNAPEYYNFVRSIEDVEKAQKSYLLRNLRLNARTEYGTQYRFSKISSIKEFQAAVPISSYEDYAPFINKIAEGKNGVLTEEPVKLFQPTSGTASAYKLIPLTRSLLMEFRRGIGPWIVGLYK